MQALPDDALTFTPWKSCFLSRLLLVIRRDVSRVSRLSRQVKEVKEVTAVNAVNAVKVAKSSKFSKSQILVTNPVFSHYATEGFKLLSHNLSSHSAKDNIY